MVRSVKSPGNDICIGKVFLIPSSIYADQQAESITGTISCLSSFSFPTFILIFSAGDYISLHRPAGLGIPFILKHRARPGNILYIYIGRNICCSALQVFSKNTTKC